MVELMGGNLDKAFKELNINAKKLVETESNYQVWSMPDVEFEFLCNVSENDWKEDFGWWRSGKCIYEGTAYVEYIVNGEKMYGYETEDEPIRTEFSSYTQWINEVMNLSTEKNVVIFAESLASDNDLKLSDFIAKYEK